MNSNIRMMQRYVEQASRREDDPISVAIQLAKNPWANRDQLSVMIDGAHRARMEGDVMAAKVIQAAINEVSYRR